MIVTRGFGDNNLIVTRGYGVAAVVEKFFENVELLSTITREINLWSPIDGN